MKFSLTGSNNGTVISALEQLTGSQFVSKELYKGKHTNHKFKPGDIVQLHGLEDYPEFNDEIVEITSIREDGEFGKAYYFKTVNKELVKQLNWTYEYRLRIIN